MTWSIWTPKLNHIWQNLRLCYAIISFKWALPLYGQSAPEVCHKEPQGTSFQVHPELREWPPSCAEFNGNGFFLEFNICGSFKKVSRRVPILLYRCAQTRVAGQMMCSSQALTYHGYQTVRGILSGWGHQVSVHRGMFVCLRKLILLFLYIDHPNPVVIIILNPPTFYCLGNTLIQSRHDVVILSGKESS